MGLLVISLGIVLNTVSRETLSISRSHARYQGLLRVSSQLERKMERDGGQSSADGVQLAEGGSESDFEKKLNEGQKTETANKVVTADPRVEQVEVTSRWDQTQMLSLSAYRLRIRRQDRPKASPSPAATNSTATNGSL
jgi:hypothetical protein